MPVAMACSSLDKFHPGDAGGLGLQIQGAATLSWKLGKAVQWSHVTWLASEFFNYCTQCQRGHELLLFKPEEKKKTLKMFYGNRASGDVESCCQLYFGGSLSVCFPMMSDLLLGHFRVWRNQGCFSGFPEMWSAWCQEVMPRVSLIMWFQSCGSWELENKHRTVQVPCGCFFYYLRYTKSLLPMVDCIEKPALKILSVGVHSWGWTMANSSKVYIYLVISQGNKTQNKDGSVYCGSL